MKELNTCLGILAIPEDGYDRLTASVHSDRAVTLTQIDSEGRLHSLILGPGQLKGLVSFVKNLGMLQ